MKEIGRLICWRATSAKLRLLGSGEDCCNLTFSRRLFIEVEVCSVHIFDIREAKIAKEIAFEM